MTSQTPAWVAQEMERQTGNWIADNKAYMSDQETDDAYGIEWKWGVGKQSLLGTLYGMKDGQKTNEYWQFIQYWDAGHQKVKVIQIASFGMIGEGHLEMTDSTHSQLIQVFTGADGNSFKSGHKTEVLGDHEVSVLYDIDAEGNWTKNRSYTWYKQNP